MNGLQRLRAYLSTSGYKVETTGRDAMSPASGASEASSSLGEYHYPVRQELEDAKNKIQLLLMETESLAAKATTNEKSVEQHRTEYQIKSATTNFVEATRTPTMGSSIQRQTTCIFPAYISEESLHLKGKSAAQSNGSSLGKSTEDESPTVFNGTYSYSTMPADTQTPDEPSRSHSPRSRSKSTIRRRSRSRSRRRSRASRSRSRNRRRSRTPRSRSRSRDRRRSRESRRRGDEQRRSESRGRRGSRHRSRGRRSRSRNGERDSKPVIPVGQFFSDIKPIPCDDRDPPLDACHNCWSRRHRRHQCTEKLRRFCKNCGRRGVVIVDCPRCATGFKEHRMRERARRREKRREVRTVESRHREPRRPRKPTVVEKKSSPPLVVSPEETHSKPETLASSINLGNSPLVTSTTSVDERGPSSKIQQVSEFLDNIAHLPVETQSAIISACFPARPM